MEPAFIHTQSKVLVELVKENKPFPNNNRLPYLLYKAVFELPDKKAGSIVKEIFALHQWSNAWKDGIYPYHHYHSITHEVLGVYEGACNVMLGGYDDMILHIEKGDVLVIPAGVAHKNVGSTDNFRCVGAYPNGMDFDMNYGRPGERPQTDRNIAQVPLPTTDPVYGYGPMQDYWNAHKG
jgi:uncharacterized protein YjlB